MKTWIKDGNGNQCSVEYWGSKEAAQTALDSLENCRDCSDCSRCSRCSRCSDCSRCSRCSRCSDLIDKQDVGVGETNAGPPPIPVIENIHQVIYTAASNPKALRMDAVHTCTNTHCRAGWVITKAAAAGLALEAFYNWELAAMLIYDASDPNFKINPVHFYDTNDDALADMKRLAETSAG